MRRRKVVLNGIIGLTLQFVMIVYGFVFPRLVLSVYGSSVNGLLQSISQFLAYISLLDAGVSAVIRAKLYKPLAYNDRVKTQRIINSARQFYKKIAFTFLLYMVIVSIILPVTYSNYFDRFYTLSLVLIIGISTFAEYFFGISYIVLLEGDQRKYIAYCIQIVSVVLNIIASIVLIKGGMSIHLVKAVTSLLFVAKPIILSRYCIRRYGFEKSYKETEPIENKWAGLGHHIAYFLHSHTDIVILTFTRGPLSVSVYSVYNMIVTALCQVISYISGGVEAAFGNMIAKNEERALRNGLQLYEILVFSLTSIFYSTAAVSIFQFVKIYTKGVNDANYILPSAGIVLILAEAVYCIRRPYEGIVMAAGKLKETMIGAYIEAVINIVLSIILVWNWGILGVATATLIAMIFRTVQYVVFVSNNIVKRSIGIFFKNAFCYGASCIAAYFTSKLFYVDCENYMEWALWAFITFCLSSIFVTLTNLLFFNKEFRSLVSMFSNTFFCKK